jgi:acyl-CoA synthetase (AMP-forming)/AMP-acid ligase II
MTTAGRNLGDVFAHHAEDERIAVVDLFDPDRPREFSFREFHDRIDAAASGFLAAGLEPGDRVAILALNRIEYLETLFGAMRAGCVPVMVNVKLATETIRFIIEDAGARIVFTDPDLADRCPEGPGVVTFDSDYDAFLQPGPFAAYDPGPDDIAEQPYTSGSTGRPKGVLLTHWGQRWMIDRLVESRDLADHDCSVISAPLYHKNALLAVKSGLAAGGRIVLFARFDVEQYIRAIERYRLTMLTGVPTMYALMLQQKELLAETDLTSVRTCSMGSAPASDNLLDSLAALLPDAALNLNYGITEGRSCSRGNTPTACPDRA